MRMMMVLIFQAFTYHPDCCLVEKNLLMISQWSRLNQGTQVLIHRVYSRICRSSTMTSAAIFITILFVTVDLGWCDHDPSPMAYWNKMFPDLAMPKMQQDDIGAKTMFEPKHFVVPLADPAVVRDDEAVANRAFFLHKNLVLDSKTQIYVPQGDCKVDPGPRSLFAPDNVKWSYLNDISSNIRHTSRFKNGGCLKDNPKKM